MLSWISLAWLGSTQSGSAKIGQAELSQVKPSCCKDCPYPTLKLCWTAPSWVPYHTLISNHPPSFSTSFNPSHHLSFTAFSLFHSEVLTLISLSLSGSCTSTLDLILTTSLPTHASHALTTALQLTLSILQHPVKWVLLSSLIFFFSSLILSFHPFFPFITSPPSCHP